MPNLLRNGLGLIAGVVIGSAVNLLAAYLPMAWPGKVLGERMQPRSRGA